MSHGITATDALASTTGGAQWHGLGKKLPAGLTAEEGFPLVGIGWETELAPVYAEVQRGVDVDGNPVIRRIHLPGHAAHLRVDTDAPLGVVSSDYQQVTNQDLAGLLDGMAGQDAASTLESAGSFFGGRRVFGCIRLPSTLRVAAEVVESYVVASNGHGGFAGLNVYPTSIRPICANTLRWSERDLGKGIRFRHVGDVGEKMRQARVAMGLALEEAAQFEERARHLIGHQLSGGQLAEFLAMAYDGAFGLLPDPSTNPEAHARLAVKRLEVLARWTALLDHPTNRVRGIEGSAWQALQAVTYWHEWERAPKLGKEQRQHSNVFGQANRDKQAALRAAMAVAR